MERLPTIRSGTRVLREMRPSHRVAMRSLAERANLLAMSSGFWKRELLSAKPSTQIVARARTAQASLVTVNSL
jgi:hypothetical protein